MQLILRDMGRVPRGPAAPSAEGALHVLDGDRVRTLGGDLPDMPVDAVPDRVYLLDRFPDGAVLLDDGARQVLQPAEPGASPVDLSLGTFIAHLQIDSRGRIWAGCSDQDMFGLVCFDRSGVLLWEDDGWPIDDCYALNVAEETAWACVCSGFPLIRVGPGFAARHWPTGLSGPRWLAVEGDRILLGAQYDDPPERCWLATLGPEGVATPVPVDLHGPDLKRNVISARGPFIHVVSKGHWWRGHIGSAAD